MNGLEFCLQVFKNLQRLAHLLVYHELIRHLKGYQKASCICFALQIGQPGQHPEQDVLQGFLITMHNFPTKIRVEIGWITKYFQKSADSLLGFVLRFLLHVNRLVGFVQVRENFVHEFKLFKRCLIIKLNHAKVLHERWSVESVDNLFDLSRVEVGRFAE